MKKTVLLFLICLAANAQDPLRFANEVELIQKKYVDIDVSKQTIVFTGSSSIKIWRNLNEITTKYQVVNSGFGGSEASDLLYYTDELILNFNPKKVFIYEGDNDIQSKKKAKGIIKNLKEIINKIKSKNSAIKIVLISAKPSLARWELKKSYLKLNRKMKRLTKREPNLDFADIWTPMLDGKSVKKDIFVSDNLHMNTKGYSIWHNVLKNYIN